MRVWLRRLAWLVGILVVLVLLVWALVPPLVKWQAQSRLSAALDRDVAIGHVAFTPWNLNLTLDDIVVASAQRTGLGASSTEGAVSMPAASEAASEAPSPAPSASATASISSPSSASAPASGNVPAATREPLLKIARIHADLSSKSLIKLAPVIEALQIDAPQLHVVRLAPGHYDIDDLIERYAEDREASSGPMHFALYNLELHDGALRLEDRPVGKVQAITDLQLSLPFISSLPADVEIKVEPHLAFKLNGAPFDSGAQATPFAATNSGTLKLAFSDLDVRPYLGYLPASLPVRLVRGTLSSDLGLEFDLPRQGEGRAVLHGTLQAQDVAVTERSGAALLSWQRLELGLRDIEPFAHRVALDRLRIAGARLQVVRDADGRLNLAQLAAAPGRSRATGTTGAASAASAASASAASAPAPAERGAQTSTAGAAAWQVSIATLDLADARIDWQDATVHPAAALALTPVQLSLKDVQWPIAKPMALTLDASLRRPTGSAAASAASTQSGEPDTRKPAPPAEAATAALGRLHIAGPVTEHSARLDLELSGLALAALQPYLAQQLVPSVAGELTAKARFDWSDDPKSPRALLSLQTATLEALRLREAGSQADALTLRQLALADIEADLHTHQATLGKVQLSQPVLQVARDAKGELNLQQWRVTPAAAERAQEVAVQKPATPPNWHVKLKDLALEDGRIEIVDASLQRRRAPVRLDLSGLRLAVHGLDWPAEPGNATASVQFGARIGAPAAPRRSATAPGSIDWNGDVGLAPLRAAGTVKIERLPVQLFVPYLGGRLPVRLAHAQASYRGKIKLDARPAGLAMSGSGDVLLADVRVDTVADPAAGIAGGNELAAWQSLALQQSSFEMKPKARPRVEIGSAVLSDFYSRLVVTEQGHFNLQELRPSGGAVAATPSAAASAASAAVPTPPATASISTQKDASASASAPAARAVETPQTLHLPLDLTIGSLKLLNGKIDFQDHFIQPNYSAALTELNGQVGHFSSTSPQMAAIELHGRAEGTAILDISGEINPLASPLQLDIKAKATDLELAPLSPYAAKYAGYAIERGKLSMNVSYKVDAEGLLTAENQLILNQLTFGEKVESPQATTLPVRLAVALLKDRNGVIDLNLPISGSLNDPHFNLGALIGKVIGNLLVKAITAPFALLTGGGGRDLSEVGFEPGTTTPTASGRADLDRVAQALTEKPQLTMTVTGAADPASEREAYRHAVLDARLQAEARREALESGKAAAAPASAPQPLSADQRAQLIRRLYRRSDFADKPRNVFGFAKDVPVAQMEALLLQHIPVTDDAMRELALQRGVAVRDALIAKGLKSERLFLAAPKLHSSKEGEHWAPQVELALSIK